jgi:peptidoglycan-N-acetylglucosamine deacetylase
VTTNPLLRHIRYRLHSRLPRLYPGAQCRLDRRDIVAVTIDDGPSSATPRLLDLLDEAGIPATFFLSGAAVPDHPGVVRTIRERGHVIGSHGFAHDDPSRRTRAEVEMDLLRSIDVIESASGANVALFRPPYGRLHPLHRDIPRKHGCRLVLWSAMPGDFEANVSRAELSRRIAALRGGEIVVLHDRPRDANRTAVCIHALGALIERHDLMATTL